MTALKEFIDIAKKKKNTNTGRLNKQWLVTELYTNAISESDIHKK